MEIYTLGVLGHFVLKNLSLRFDKTDLQKSIKTHKFHLYLRINFLRAKFATYLDFLNQNVNIFNKMLIFLNQNVFILLGNNICVGNTRSF